VTSPIKILVSAGTVNPASSAMVRADWPTMSAFSAPLTSSTWRTASASASDRI
jgi:hypothetical protein